MHARTCFSQRLIRSGGWRGTLIGLAAFGLGLGSVGLRGANPASQRAVLSAGSEDRTATGPRLFFTTDRVRRLQERSGSDPVIQSACESLVRKAEGRLQEDFVSRDVAEGGSGQHGNYGAPSSQMSALGGTLGLAYRLTGDGRYADRLREAMLHYGALERWAGDAGWDPPWRSELNTARFCFGYAVAYDSIRESLSPSDRERIAADIVRLGILPTLEDWVMPGRRFHALDSMGHNWWSVCVSMAGVASLAILEDDPRAAVWIEQVASGFPEWFAYQGNRLQNKSPNFDRKGAFYESVSYANYALSEYLLFRSAYASCFGQPPPAESPLVATAGDFFVHTSYPTADRVLSVNFGDSSLNAQGAKTLQLLLANGFNQPSYHWYLNRTRTGFEDPLGLILSAVDPAITSPPDWPTAHAYPDIGWAMLRSSWDDNATLLAVKSGFTWNHAHPDAGSFILFHQGMPLVIDSGNCSYSRREYTSYYRHSRAHNVILIDGEAQNPEDCARGDRGVALPGTVDHLLDGAGLKYVLADATGPTAWKFSRNYRHFLWLDGVVLIVDDVRAHTPGQLEWLLHTEGEVKPEGEGVRLKNGAAAQALVVPLFPAGMTLERRPGLKDHDPDTPVDFLAWLPPGDQREAKFLTALVPLPDTGDESRVNLQRWEDTEALGVRIRSREAITDVYLNLRADGRKMHRNSCHVLDGWETDAYLLAVTRPAGTAPGDGEALKRIFVAGGSYVRRDGRTFLDSLSKVYGVFGWAGSALDVGLSGQPLMNVALFAPSRPTKLRVNGEPRDVTFDETHGLVRIRSPRQ